jgi:hypothetical protein
MHKLLQLLSITAILALSTTSTESLAKQVTKSEKAEQAKPLRYLDCNIISENLKLYRCENQEVICYIAAIGYHNENSLFCKWK